MKFTPTGKVKIEVDAEVYGAWCVTEGFGAETEGAFVVTHRGSGQRLPPPCEFWEIDNARKLAKLIDEQFGDRLILGSTAARMVDTIAAFIAELVKPLEAAS